MIDEDRKAIREAYANACKQCDISTDLTETGDWADERAEIVATAVNIAWLAATAHEREKVRELVEAVEAVNETWDAHDFDGSDEAARVDIAVGVAVAHAAKLKVQPTPAPPPDPNAPETEL